MCADVCVLCCVLCPRTLVCCAQHADAARILEAKGLREGRLKFVLDEGGGHHESAWGWRLSGALMHLFHGRA